MRWLPVGAVEEGGKLGIRTASEFSWQTRALERERERRQQGRQRVPVAAAQEGNPRRRVGEGAGKLLWGARCERAKMKRVRNPLHKLDLISCATNLAI